METVGSDSDHDLDYDPIRKQGTHGNGVIEEEYAGPFMRVHILTQAYELSKRSMTLWAYQLQDKLTVNHPAFIRWFRSPYDPATAF